MTSVSDSYRRSSVGSSMASSGVWLARMPIDPLAVRVETISTSPSNTWPSGLRISTGNFVRAIAGPARPLGIGLLLLLRLLRGLFAPARLGHDLVDRALEQEGALGDLVVLALEDLREAADRLGDRHILAARAGELLGHREGLGEEALDAPGTVHREAVLVGELLDAQDRDDVLELLVALKGLLDPVGDRVVLLPHDLGLEDRR